MADQNVVQIASPLSGRATFDGTTCQLANEIEPGDLVAANFDVKDVHTGGGLYLVEEHQAGRVTWRGCRRMARVPDGVSVDVDGQSSWRTFPDLESVNWHVVGQVETVYKRKTYQ